MPWLFLFITRHLIGTTIHLHSLQNVDRLCNCTSRLPTFYSTQVVGNLLLTSTNLGRCSFVLYDQTMYYNVLRQIVDKPKLLVKGRIPHPYFFAKFYSQDLTFLQNFPSTNKLQNVIPQFSCLEKGFENPQVTNPCCMLPRKKNSSRSSHLFSLPVD